MSATWKLRIAKFLLAFAHRLTAKAQRCLDVSDRMVATALVYIKSAEKDLRG